VSITIDRPHRSLRRTLAGTATITLAAAAICVAVAAPASAHPVLSISASPTTLAAGNTVTLTISGTSNGNYSNARIEVFASTPSSGGTTGSLTSFTSSPNCGGSPGTVTCAEITNRYKIGNINLTNSQAFSYTVTFTVDEATAAGTFTSKAQFYKSDNTTDGPTTGPLITVTPAQADLEIRPYDTYYNGQIAARHDVVNNGPATVNSATLTVSVDRSGLGTFDEVVSDADCTITDNQHATCSLVAPIAPDDGIIFDSYFNVNLLALGTYVITSTVTVNSPTDPVSTNNTVVTTCNVLTGLIVTCSQA